MTESFPNKSLILTAGLAASLAPVLTGYDLCKTDEPPKVKNPEKMKRKSKAPDVAKRRAKNKQQKKSRRRNRKK